MRRFDGACRFLFNKALAWQKNLERVYKNFFAKRTAFPRFKKKGHSDSFRYPQGCKLDQENSRLFLPKLGWVRYRNSREVLGAMKNLTVSHKVGKGFITIQTERDVEQPVPQGTSAVSITGRRQKPASSVFTSASAMPAATTCTSAPPRSAKTTRWCVLRTCRYVT